MSRRSTLALRALLLLAIISSLAAGKKHKSSSSPVKSEGAFDLNPRDVRGHAPPSSELSFEWEDDDSFEDYDEYPDEAWGGRSSASGVRLPDTQILKEQLKNVRSTVGARVVSAKHKAKKLAREARTTVSSDLESVLLKATRPDNMPAKKKYVDVLVNSTSKHFPRFMKSSSPGAKSNPVGYDSNPYEQLLSKLWKKMLEKDWRTVAKALYILHRLALEVSDKSWRYLAYTFVSLRSSRKRGAKRMFTRKGVLNLTAEADDHRMILETYSQHVWTRLVCLTPSLSELDGVADDMIIEKCRRVLRTALACRPLLQDGMDSDIVCDLVEILLRDFLALWAKYQGQVQLKINTLRVNESSQKELRQALRTCEFYEEVLEDATSFAADSRELLASYGIAHSTEVRPPLDDHLRSDFTRKIKEKLKQKI